MSITREEILNVLSNVIEPDLKKDIVSANLVEKIEFNDTKVLEGHIECSAMKENSIFVDASGKVFPCCWQVEGNYQPNIVQWFYDLSENWNNNPDSVCKKSCLKNTTGTTFTNQWYREVEIK